MSKKVLLYAACAFVLALFSMSTHVAAEEAEGQAAASADGATKSLEALDKNADATLNFAEKEAAKKIFEQQNNTDQNAAGTEAPAAAPSGDAGVTVLGATHGDGQAVKQVQGDAEAAAPEQGE